MCNQLIAPSILSADFSDLKSDIYMVNDSEADWFHIDIMDGVFVPNISFGMPVLKSINEYATKTLDVHLMIVNPEKYFEKFAELGSNILTIHYEVSKDILGDSIKEIKKYAKSGVKEITLLGQNVNAYHGYDINKIERKLDYLINKISEINDIKRIRYMTSHPKDMNINLIKCHKDNSKLMPFLHLPIQSGSNKILKKMNRKYSVEEYEQTIDAIKSYRDDIAISSDFIVGFPGETEDDFLKTIDLIKDIEFDQSYSFIYSKRPGTPAASLEDNTPYSVKKERLKFLQETINSLSKNRSKSIIGEKAEVLVEGVS